MSNRFLILFILTGALTACNPLGSTPEQLGVFQPGVPYSSVSVSTVDVSNNILTLNGSGLDQVNDVQIGGMGSFLITSQSASRIQAVALSSISLALNQVFKLIVSDAYGANGTTITFSIPAGSVVPSMLDRAYVQKSGDTMSGPLTVGGVIQSTSGGFKFPDGTVQTTAAGGGASQWTTSGSNIYYSAGNVGIGTAAPLANLHVTSGGTSSRLLVQEGTAQSTAESFGVYGNDGTTARLSLKNLNTVANPRIALGIGMVPSTFTDGTSLQLAGGATNWQIQNRQVNGASSDQFQISVQGGNPVLIARQDNNNLLLAPITGNVGIGTAAPAFSLDVSGGMRVNTQASSTIVLGNAVANSQGVFAQISPDTYTGTSMLEVSGPRLGGATYVLNIKNYVNGTQLASIKPDGTTYFAGNVGIGTTSPAVKLDVSGNMYVRGNGLGVIQLSQNSIEESAPYPLSIGTAYGNDLTIYTNGFSNPRMTIQSTGNVGIGVTNPGQRLQVGSSGDGSVAIANAWSTFSDIRLKKDLEKVPNACEMLDQLNGYYYYWKAGEDQSRQVGVIAQEVEKVLPELVKTGSDGIKTVDYPKLTAVLIEASKQHNRDIASINANAEDTEARTAKLEAENAKLKQENVAIKSYLCSKDPGASICAY